MVNNAMSVGIMVIQNMLTINWQRALYSSDRISQQGLIVTI